VPQSDKLSDNGGRAFLTIPVTHAQKKRYRELAAKANRKLADFIRLVIEAGLKLKKEKVW
jgi:hypothetical protein